MTIEVTQIGDFLITRDSPSLAHFEYGHTWCNYMSPVDDSLWDDVEAWVGREGVKTLRDFAYDETNKRHQSAYLHLKANEFWDYWHYEEIWMGADFEIDEYVWFGHLCPAEEIIYLHREDDIVSLSCDPNDAKENSRVLTLLELGHLCGQTIDIPYGLAMIYPELTDVSSIGYDRAQVFSIPTASR